MTVLCHYHEVSVIPFLDLCVPLQRIGSAKTNCVIPKLKHRKAISVAQNGQALSSHILTNFLLFM